MIRLILSERILLVSKNRWLRRKVRSMGRKARSTIEVSRSKREDVLNQVWYILTDFKEEVCLDSALSCSATSSLG